MKIYVIFGGIFDRILTGNLVQITVIIMYCHVCKNVRKSPVVIEVFNNHGAFLYGGEGEIRSLC